MTSTIGWMRTTNTLGAEYTIEPGYGLLVGALGALVSVGVALSVCRAEKWAQRVA